MLELPGSWHIREMSKNKFPIKKNQSQDGSKGLMTLLETFLFKVKSVFHFSFKKNITIISTSSGTASINAIIITVTICIKSVSSVDTQQF